ncbi:MAG: serine protease [Planctomycetaceae bacterium]|nr:serine protease [Planctomycetaceae bacterium]
MSNLIDKCEPSVVRIDVESAGGKSCGSGFVFDKSGLIITNYHVIAGASRAICAFRDGSEAKVEGFLKIDPLRDVAIIKVNHPADKLHPIKLRSDLPRKGEKVVAFGAPLGLSWTATEGIISAFRPKAELVSLGMDGIEGDWIQTSTPISPGNSGGPLVTYAGEVIAMNTMQFTIGQNLNFAVQAKEIELVLKQSEGAQLVALAPALLPEAAKAQAPKIVDVTKDERGRKALGRLKEVTLLTAMSRDPTGHIQSVVRKKALDTARQLGLMPRDGDESDNEFMLVTMHFEEDPNSRTGAVEVHVSAVVFMRDRNADGKVEVLKVWEREEKLGSLPDRLFASGEFSKPIMEKLTSFFGKFKGSYHSAHREVEKAAADASKSKANDKT